MTEQLIQREEDEAVDDDVRMASPACSVYESADEYLVLAEVPGVVDDGVDIRLDRTQLSIRADRKLDGDAGEVGTLRYARVFEVPETIDSTQISASLSEGVLHLRMPKAPQARVRRIQVTAG